MGSLRQMNTKWAVFVNQDIDMGFLTFLEITFLCFQARLS